MNSETRDRIKAATRDLIRAAGGPNRSVDVAGRGQASRFSDYGAHHVEGSFIPVDMVASLEAEIGSPILTRVLADVAGCDVVPRAIHADPDSHMAHLAKLSMQAGDLASSLATALADGRIDHTEINGILKGIAGLRDQLNGMERDIKGPKLAAVSGASGGGK